MTFAWAIRPALAGDLKACLAPVRAILVQPFIRSPPDYGKMPGTIILLNGTSSSGKTTLLKTLQAALPEPFLDSGLDRFLWMLPKRYLEPPL
jgi:chloramphenicol 3-O-phosphotransferase